jgi:hypothetical protein
MNSYNIGRVRAKIIEVRNLFSPTVERPKMINFKAQQERVSRTNTFNFAEAAKYVWLWLKIGFEESNCC